jgi:6-pyruvoyl-tetrahydropterin synthase
MTTCPKCNYERNPSDIECPKCGIVYKKYEDYVSKKQQEIEKETNKEEKFNTEKTESLGTHPQNSQIEKREEIPKKDKSGKKFYFIVILIALIGGYVFIHQTPEIKARRVVDTHLKSIMTGNGDPYATVDITKIKELFINVLDFKYLNTLKKERVQNDPMVFNQEFYEEHGKKIYDSYAKFLQEMKRIYSDRAIETEEGLIVKSKDYHYEFEFLYDVTLTNKLGMKLYKKYVFEVKPSLISDSGYVITGFYER